MIDVPPKRIWAKDEINAIIHKYTEEGLTTVQISKEFCTKADTISKLLKQNGVKMCKGKKNRLFNEDYFEIIDSPTKAYFLGLMFTDGNVSYDTEGIRAPFIRIGLAEYDSDILIKFKKELRIQTDFCISDRPNKKTPICNLGIRNKKMANDLSKYGIVSNKTEFTSSLPLNDIPSQYHTDFFRGIIDGDGSIYKSGGGWHLNVCGHKESLIKEIYELGCSISNQEANCKPTLYDNVYRITWNGDKAKKLLSTIYYDNCCSLSRKYNKVMEAINS